MQSAIAVQTAVCRIALVGSLCTVASSQITQVIDNTGNGSGYSLSGPSGVAVNAAGDVFVSGFLDHVFRVEPGGATGIIIDGTGSGSAALSVPGGLALDASGNAFVGGALSDNAFRISPTGSITEIVDASGDGVGRPLDNPVSMVVDSAGNAYVAGRVSDNVFMITPAGAVTEVIDASGDGQGNPLDWPKELAVDAAGNLYVLGHLSQNAFRITAPGQPGQAITQIIDQSGDGKGNPLALPHGIATDHLGNVYVTGSTTRNAFQIAAEGGIREIIDWTGDGVNQLLDTRAVAADSRGNVYVVGGASHNAFRIVRPGQPTQSIDEIIDQRGDGSGNTLSFPHEVAVGPDDEVYVAGGSSANVFRIDIRPCRVADGSLVIRREPGTQTGNHLRFDGCIGPLDPGASGAEVGLRGAPAHAPSLLLGAFPPVEYRSFGDGALVGPVSVGVALVTDALGQVTLELPRGIGPAALVAQWAVLDPGSPAGMSLSNALEIAWR